MYKFLRSEALLHCNYEAWNRKESFRRCGATGYFLGIIRYRNGTKFLPDRMPRIAEDVCVMSQTLETAIPVDKLTQNESAVRCLLYFYFYVHFVTCMKIHAPEGIYCVYIFLCNQFCSHMAESVTCSNMQQERSSPVMM